MNCIIVDDEPVARKGMKSLVEQIPQLTLWWVALIMLSQRLLI